MHGQLAHGGTAMQNTSKIIWIIPQGPVATILDQDFGTERHNAFPILQTVYGPM